VGARAPGAGWWWLGSASVALILMISGAVCLAARKFGPQGVSGLVQVVGRVNLTSKQTIFLVKAGPRFLLIGSGPQGAPTLLGELPGTDQDGSGDLAAASQRAVLYSPQRLDVRLGEEG
jgi:hypothetical protein